MSPSAKRTPSYRLHKPSGQAVVRLSGHDHYLGPHNSDLSRREYDRVVGEWLSQRSIRPTVPGAASFSAYAGISVGELMLSFLDHAKSYYRKNGRPTGEVDLLKISLKPVRRLYALQPITEFGPCALKLVREEMIESGLCRTEINRRIGRIVRMFKWGVEQELVDPMIHHALAQVQPLKRGRTIAREPEPIRPVEDERVETIFPHIARQVKAMIELQRQTAMRPGEVCQMRSGDIDRSGDVWIYVPQEHKTEHHGHDRRIFLGKRAQEVLIPWLREEEDAYLFSPKEAETERRAALRASRKTKVQPSQKNRRKAKPKRTAGECYDRNSYYRAIQRGCKKAEVERWHPNQLRHTAATKIRKKHGIEAASLLLGHRGVGVTQVYAERDEQKALEIVLREG